MEEKNDNLDSVGVMNEKTGEALGHNTQKENKAWWALPMALFFRMSTWIVIPVIIAAFLGKWFDNRYSTNPWGVLGFIGLSFLISMFGIVRQANKEYSKISKDSQAEKEKDTIKKEQNNNN